VGRTILTTFAIGQRYEALWRTYCQTSWENYAERHGFELEVITKPLQEDQRSPAWQKLCLPEHFYDAGTVLFVDADIIFSGSSRNLLCKLASAGGLVVKRLGGKQ